MRLPGWHALRRRFADPFARQSYAQCGEDLIVRHLLLEVLGRTQVRYLDIGAHHPWILSNTALFYRMGFRGVCVEPDAGQFGHFRRERAQDVCLNVGIGMGEETEADFYVLSSPTLSTFSREEADRCVADGHRLEQVARVPLLSANHVLAEHFPRPPDFVTIDVEGLDEAVLRSIDFQACRPAVFSIETVTHARDRRQWRKRQPILDFMAEQGYFAYADTFINTIFVNRDLW